MRGRTSTWNVETGTGSELIRVPRPLAQKLRALKESGANVQDILQVLHALHSINPPDQPADHPSAEHCISEAK